MKSFFCSIIISLFLLSASAIGQNVTIIGKVNKSNCLIRLFTCEDLLNSEYTECFLTHSDDDGHFIIHSQINAVMPAQIAVDLDRIDFVVSPNATYDFQIEIPSTEDYVSFFEKPLPSLRIKKASDRGLYRQLSDAEDIINNFILNHFNEIYRQRKLSYVDSLRDELQQQFPDGMTRYVDDYVEYKLASTKLAIYSDGVQRVIQQHFDGKKILYLQPAYMDLFKEVFVHYFWNRKFDTKLFKEAFYKSPEALRHYLESADPIIANNKQLAELILIYNLGKMYHEEPHDREYIIAHLDALEENTTQKQHKTIIKNLRKRQSQFAQGAPAIDFSLNDAEGNKTKLSDFSDRLVLLQFVDAYAPTIQQQFDKLRQLHEQWQDTVLVITIASQERFKLYQDKFREQKISWPLLNLDDDILLLEKYNVKTFPEYVIIKPGTKIGMAPAPAPDQFLDYHIRRLYRQQ